MAAIPKIKLYVDTVSPFGYEAYWILRVSSCFISLRLFPRIFGWCFGLWIVGDKREGGREEMGRRMKQGMRTD